VDAARLRDALDEYFDGAILFHGYTDYMRDYEIVASPLGAPAGVADRLIFENCVHMSAESALPDGGWAKSLDPRLIDYDQGVDLDGYVWGVKWQVLYPGFEVVDDSTTAADWSQRMGFPLHEVRAATNGHHLRLVVTDLRVEPAPPGYRPYELKSVT
jgi:hypothetical protein